jgi:hypothetical protein
VYACVLIIQPNGKFFQLDFFLRKIVIKQTLFNLGFGLVIHLNANFALALG